MAAFLHFACAALLLSAVCGFQICTLPASFNTRIFATAKANTNDNNNANIDVDGKEGIIRAMEDARKSQNSGLSPGAQMVSAKIEYLATQRRIYLPTSRNSTSSSLFLYRFHRFCHFIVSFFSSISILQLSADEQRDAAYADLINTSMDQRGIDELSQGELVQLHFIILLLLLPY